MKPSPAAPNKVAPQTPVSLFRFYRSGRSWALGMGFSAGLCPGSRRGLLDISGRPETASLLGR